MRRLLILGALVGVLVAAAPASAAWRAVVPVPTIPACPTGVPVQTITVVDQAQVPPLRLAQVERAVVAQSLQLRRWWGTPCVQFAPGGWPLYLKKGPFQDTQGVHYAEPTRMIVWTGQLNYEMWSVDFTHEIIETLVDPTTGTEYETTGTGYQLEVADPVDCVDGCTKPTPYRLDGVNVADFVTPNWYAGARIDECETESDGTMVCDGPLIAPADAAGPYDQARVLTRPWQTLSDS